MSEMTPRQMRQYLWEFYKLVNPGSSGELTDEMGFPESLVMAALKTLNYKLSQARVSEFYWEEQKKVYDNFRHSQFHWEKPPEETSKEQL